MYDMLVRGGEVVFEGSVAPADIAISNGRIAAILERGAPAEARETIDAGGRTVIPGAIDAHFHFSMPGEDHLADDFGSASISAAHGGITTIVPFALGQAELGLRGFLEQSQREGEATSVVDFAFHCRIPSPSMELIRQIPDAVKMGVTSFKVFLAYRREGVMCDDYHLLAVAQAVARENALLMVHCEEGAYIDYLEDELMRAGRFAPTDHLASRPNEFEASAIDRVARIARMTGCRLHVVHLSAREGLQEIAKAKADGVPLTTETCPQYLLLNESAMERMGGLAKIGPPLRTESDQEAMWYGLQCGLIDMAASDHAPNFRTMKALPPDRFAEVPYGMASTETMVPLLYSEGVLTGRLTIDQMARAVSTNPARIHGLYPRKGAIRPGSDADLVLLDPAVEWEIRAEDLHTQSDYTAYQGRRMKGRPVMSLLRGRVLLQEGRLEQAPGYGQYLPRAVPDRPVHGWEMAAPLSAP